MMIFCVSPCSTNTTCAVYHSIERTIHHDASCSLCSTVYIRTVSSLRLLSTLMIQDKLVCCCLGRAMYMHCTPDFFPRPANVPLHMKGLELTVLKYIYCTVLSIGC